MNEIDNECILCSETIRVYGALDCGHYMCLKCALKLRMFRSSKTKASVTETNCPICRNASERLVLTSSPPPSSDGYPKSDLQAIAVRSEYAADIKTLVDGDAAANEVNSLVGYFCPLDQCWVPDPATGAVVQTPFLNMELLREHLKIDHAMKYCKLCFDFKPAFLAEQKPRTNSELDQHNRGRCAKDPSSFNGHPLCLFCGQRFYDGDALLNHMQMHHLSCDLCNAGEFTFVYYKNREWLIKHFNSEHKLCVHKDCVEQDPMLRVYRDEMALQAHLVRAHGQAQKLSAASLGFNFSIGSAMPAPAALPRPAPGAPGGPANPSNTHADRIIFDFINKREEVVTTPAQRNAQQQPRATESAAELNKALMDAMQTHLPSASQKEAMKNFSQDFIKGKTKATEYFTQLQSLLPNPAALNAVFTPLVATLPDAVKRDALIAAKTMLMSSEATKLREMAAEAAKAAELEELKKKHAAQRQAMKAAKATAPKGVWTKSPAVHSGVHAPPQAAAPAAPTAAKLWATPSAPAAPLAASSFMDPEAFPTLGSPTTQKKRGTGPKAGPVTNNAWGRR